MSDKKASTPKEIPLHEVVLKIMFEANKERPAELTVSQVYSKINDPAISEIQILQVLKWLVNQKEVEVSSNKYALDRFSFLDERKKDYDEQGLKILTTKDLPLHELVLHVMFEANKTEPVQFTFDDIFWKISDPKVLKTHLTDVLNWLKNQLSVEYKSGKYSIHIAEFQDQQQAELKAKPKKVAKKKKPKKKAEESKIVIPAAPEKPKPKEEPKAKLKDESDSKESEQVQKKIKEKVVPPKPEEVPKNVQPKVVPPAAPVKEEITPVEETKLAKGKVLVFIVGMACSILTLFLLYLLDSKADSFESIRYIAYFLNVITLVLFAWLFYNYRSE